MSDPVDREYVSRYATGRSFGIQVRKDGAPADADGNLVTVALVAEQTNTQVFLRDVAGGGIIHPEEGAYVVTLTSEDTNAVGAFRLDWSYSIDGTPETYAIYLAIGASSPVYDSLDPGFQGIIESVYARFADLFDSPLGGPHLATYFQSNFGRGRMAQLLRVAVNRLNTISQPFMSYSVDGPKVFPFAQWGGLLEQALYIETIKHFIRSFTEMPEWALGQGVSRADRRDYMQRWQAVLDMEAPDLKEMMDVFKIAHMGLSRPRVLVAGGVFGQMAPFAPTGAYEGRPRFYPVVYGTG